MPESPSAFAERDPAPRVRPPAAPYIVRAGTSADAPDVRRIESALRGGDVEHLVVSFERAVELSGREAFIAEADGLVVGFAKVARMERDPASSAPAGWYLVGVTVARGWRRLGVGHELTAARLTTVREHAATAWYFTNASNRASLALHERFSFLEVDRGPMFHGTTFSGGEGVLLRANRPPRD